MASGDILQVQGSSYVKVGNILGPSSGGTVTSVSASGNLSSSGGTTPTISISNAPTFTGSVSASAFIGDGSQLINLPAGSSSFTTNVNTTGVYQQSGATVLNTYSASTSTAVGVNAAKVSTGANNVCLGYGAGQSIVAGNTNVAIGSGAFSASTASSIVAVGYQAANGATGNVITAIGYQALYSGTGGDNCAVGNQALYKVGAGVHNAAFGNAAIGNNVGSIGSYNVACGASALFLSNQSASYSTAVGFQALYAGASNCVGVGYAALSGASGSNNIGIGYNAMTGLSGGTNVIGIGASCAPKAGADTYEIIIGPSITGQGSNSIAIQTGTAPGFFSGTGVPAFSAPNGSIFMRYDGGSGTRMYINQSGASTSGTVWAAIAGS